MVMQRRKLTTCMICTRANYQQDIQVEFGVLTGLCQINRSSKLLLNRLVQTLYFNFTFNKDEKLNSKFILKNLNQPLIPDY